VSTVDMSRRPRPLLEKLKTVGGVLAALSGLVAWGASAGLLTTQQSAASSALIALVPGVLTAVGALLASFGVVKSSEPLVTPTSDPRAEMVVDGRFTLVPLVPSPDWAPHPAGLLVEPPE
jgi:hypothetical protein